MNKIIATKKAGLFALLFYFVVCFQFSISAQSPDSGETKKKETVQAGFSDFKFDSKLMRREMPYRVVLPAVYESDKLKRFPVIYLIHGLGGNFKNWTEVTKIERYAKGYDFIIVMPDGGNGWYSDSVSAENDKYESYFIKEFIAEIDKKFRTIADKNGRIIAGLSMGGYGAVKFGLKYPDKFALIGSFSGAFDAPLRFKDHPQARDSINEVFGGDENQARKTNDIFRILREKSAEQIKELPFFYIDCGTEDHLFETNREFLSLLVKRKVPHEYRELPGVHNWIYWNRQIEEFLQVTEKRTNRKSKAAV